MKNTNNKPTKKLMKIALIIILLISYILLLNRVQSPTRTDYEADPEGSIRTATAAESELSVVEEFIRDKAKRKHGEFLDYLKKYWRQMFLVYGIGFSLLIYFLLLSGLFSRYFNVRPWWGNLLKMVITMLECLPHALLVLFFYSLLSGGSSWLPVILICIYATISIPFVYSMMDDEFALAKTEGWIENLLIDPLPDRKILWTFVLRNKKSLFFMPVSILIAMMVYMDFCYSGVRIYLYQESPFKVFFSLWDSSNAHHEVFKNVIKQEILVLLVLLIPIALLLYRGTKNEGN